MTSLTDTQVVTASGGLVELGYQSTNRTNLVISATTQATAVELVSTTVVCDGSPILIELDMGVAVNAGEYIAVNVFVDGTATYGFTGSLNAAGRQSYSPTARITPAAGSRTISIRWYRWGGSTLSSYIEGDVVLRVSKIVQATQWPAVTTGTIICTSSTRPASPFEGQQIYETDTDLEYVYNGSSWVPPTSVTPSISNYWSSISATGFSQATVAGTPTTVEHDSGDISFDTSTGEYTLPSDGLYMAHFHCAPTSGAPFPMTIVLERTGTMEHPRIAQSADGVGWASYTSINATGIVIANGDRKMRARIFSNNTATFAVWVRIAKIAGL